MKELVVFDLDGTLAESKSPIDAEMAQLLNSLLDIVNVAVISGGAWKQFETQVLARLSRKDPLGRLSLSPTCGTKFYAYNSGWKRSRDVDRDHESIWISYCPMPSGGIECQRVGLFNSHHRLAAPVAPWERLKVGSGTPPVLTRLGWLVIYHGVSEASDRGNGERPREIRYRSAEPILTPTLPRERSGTVANVVFQTGIDQRSDLGSRDRFDVYYGMADNRVGVARLDLPDVLPTSEPTLTMAVGTRRLMRPSATSCRGHSQRRTVRIFSKPPHRERGRSGIRGQK